VVSASVTTAALGDEAKAKILSLAITILAPLLTLPALTGDSQAAPQQLNCLLTDTLARPGSQSRPVTVVYDEDDKTLTAEAAGRHYTFSKVTITYIAINGHADDVVVGIDRSSLGIIWQQYGTEEVGTEYGHCRPAPVKLNQLRERQARHS